MHTSAAPSHLWLFLLFTFIGRHILSSSTAILMNSSHKCWNLTTRTFRFRAPILAEGRSRRLTCTRSACSSVFAYAIGDICVSRRGSSNVRPPIWQERKDGVVPGRWQIKEGGDGERGKKLTGQGLSLFSLSSFCPPPPYTPAPHPEDTLAAIARRDGGDRGRWKRRTDQRTKRGKKGQRVAGRVSCQEEVARELGGNQTPLNVVIDCPRHRRVQLLLASLGLLVLRMTCGATGSCSRRSALRTKSLRGSGEGVPGPLPASVSVEGLRLSLRGLFPRPLPPRRGE